MKEEISRIFATEQPLLVLGLGLCPALAVTATAVDGLAMGLATTLVLAGANLIASAGKGLIPEKARILCLVIIGAAFASVAQLLLRRWWPAIELRLGIYVPLIAVNCLLFSRSTVSVWKSAAMRSFFRGLLMGVSFTLSLLLISVAREAIGSNAVFGRALVPGAAPVALVAMAPGAFFTLALVFGFVNFWRSRSKK